MLETAGVAADDGLLDAWRTRVAQAQRHLQWPAGCTVRRHATGCSLFVAAPCDQLFTATEVDEWAWCAAVHERDPTRWPGLEAAWLAEALEQATDPATVVPPVLADEPALARLRALATAESRPRLRALLAAAASRTLPHTLDDDALTLGAGVGGQTWTLDALPDLDQVTWDALQAIPTAVVTGSNGKTTSVRLIAACLRSHGWRDGYSCTDGVFVGREVVEAGDYSGPAGTRRVVRDRSVQAAVLETARGGLLRRGLALDRANVALVTNVEVDHLGEYGIDDLDGLADAKLTVAQLVGGDGLLVLNAEDASLRSKAPSLAARLGRAGPPLGWFALDFDHPGLGTHRAGGGATAGVRDGRLLVSYGAVDHDLGAIVSMPLTARGAATYNVANLAGAALAACALGVPATTIARVAAEFGADAADNAGRLMRFERNGAQWVVDYAHNPDGLRGVLEVTRRLRAPGGRFAVLLGHAGNRRDEDYLALARAAAQFAPDLVVVKENEGQLRGRAPGDVPAILHAALLEHGVRPGAIVRCDSELAAARYAFDWAGPGDAVALLLHGTAVRAEALHWLQR